MSKTSGLRRLLATRIAMTLNAREPFKALPLQLSEWVAQARTPRGGPAGVEPAASTVVVEVAIARYLAEASRVGRRWGIAVGVALGTGVAIVIILVSWAYTEVIR